ncbi:MAG: pyrroloquinoline quinone biosynthesis protein PqqC [Thaumarchaeota archaeon S15]|nr:MAG: pyrroloquinoline quinone biosynthesis protein PqqC [Thaumarchaeota archaeon S15]
MADVISAIDALIEERSLLKHPFYQKWSEGTLEASSLAGYSQEYYQLARAVPGFVGEIASRAPAGADMAEIEGVMAEEREHVPMWERFAGSLGVSRESLVCGGRPATLEAVGGIAGLMRTFEGGASAMYALEKEIPKISHTKLEGLSEFYGITSDEATEYLRVHTEADIRHAAVWSGIVAASPSPDEMISAAGASLDAQNRLLDSCYEAYC